MRLAYLGTSPFAAGVLERLLDADHGIALVVTRPDRPAGRGRRLQSPAVAEAARAHGLPLLQPEDVNGAEARGQIAAARPDLLVVCAFGALVKAELLDAHEVLNVHPSLLPRWRGAAPIERAIMAGDAETGVCIMRLTLGLDSGPVCAEVREPIRPDDTYGSLAARLEALGAAELVRVLDERPACREQPEEGVTYAEKLGAADRTLDLADAVAAERAVRALAPHVGARVALPDGSYLGVRAARLAADGRLELLEVQPAGGRPMPYADYLRGAGEPVPGAAPAG